ncbi:MAG TPA: cytochrome c [Chitinophagaceae bacterium]|nr:cytochrome c [Chitinophagaceae bacterium]
MIKKLIVITGCVVLAVATISCGDTRRSPGVAYMPDMTYSRAYETYAPAQERLKASAVAGEAHFTGRPVEGTIARGDMPGYRLKNDSSGYLQSASVKSPLIPGSINMKEAERLYLVNCGICHGAKLDGNGPLFKGGDGPYTAAPKDFTSAEMKAMSEGTMFHSVTYGKGQMGSYASQLNTKQRWEVIAYIKSKQFPAGAPVADTTAKQAVDSAATVATTK